MARRRSRINIFVRGLVLLGAALICVFAALVALYAFVPPVSTLMLARKIEGKSVERVYIRLRDIAPVAVAAVIASEDAQFCQNDGVEWGALYAVTHGVGDAGPKRGASTITMQTAKNLFLWPGRSFVRKGIEIAMALVLGKAWSKSHTIEVYLNIAEWGDGLYGIEAAAERHFHKRANALSLHEGALLATSLPNPIKRNPAQPTAFQRRLAATVEARAADSATLLSCLAR